jgi:hypothetical protein
LLGNQVKLTLEPALDDSPSGMRHWLANGAGQKPIPRFPDGQPQLFDSDAAQHLDTIVEFRRFSKAEHPEFIAAYVVRSRRLPLASLRSACERSRSSFPIFRRQLLLPLC